MQNAHLDPVHFPVKIINNITIVRYREQTTMTDNQLRIAIPSSMIDEVVRWYHLVLGHPESQRLYNTINARFSYPGLSKTCQQYQCPYGCGFDWTVEDGSEWANFGIQSSDDNGYSDELAGDSTN